MNSSLISIIIPVYKVEEYLDECVQSVIDQTYKNLEIILIDDGSPDNCGKICDAWAEKDSRIKVIHKENGGLSDARNAGIDMMRGEYVFFLDSDDYIEKNCIEDLYLLAEKNKAEIVSTSMRDFKEGSIPIEASRDAEFIVGNAYDMLILMYKEYFWEACGRLFKKSLFENFRFKKGVLYEDFLLIPRVFAKSSKTVYYNSKQYYYRKRFGSIMRNNIKSDLIENAQENYEYFKNEGYTEAQLTEIFKKLKLELNKRRFKANKDYIKKFKTFEKKYFTECVRAKNLFYIYVIKVKIVSPIIVGVKKIFRR